jgi:hypothetical protein
VILSLLPPTAAAALVAAAAAAGTTAPRPARPVVSLSATPAHLTLLGGIPQTLLVHNDGAARMRVSARPASFAFDLYGNPSIGPSTTPARSAETWLAVQPRRLVLRPGQEGLLRIVARPPRRASPGDHHALVLLSASAPGRAPVAIRTRIGVLVLVRVRGRIVRRVTLGRVWLTRVRHRRFVAVRATNRGNVAERLLPGDVSVSFRRGGRVVAVAKGLAQDLLPHTSGAVLAPLAPALRGRFTAVIRIAAQPGWRAGASAPRLAGSSRRVRLGI